MAGIVQGANPNTGVGVNILAEVDEYGNPSLAAFDMLQHELLGDIRELLKRILQSRSRRALLVDPDGNPISPAQPLPVLLTGQVSSVSLPLGNLQAAPFIGFDQLTNQAGATQQGTLFPTTIAIAGGALPAVGSGAVVPLTNSGHVCGAIFSPMPSWDSALLDVAGVGAAASKTLTVEVGRLKARGAIPDVLASAVFTTGALTLGPTGTNPFTGEPGHSSVTWRFFDATTITAYSQQGDVLQAVSGTAGSGPSQLKLNVHDEAYYYVLITALDASFTEVLTAITPVS